MKKKKFGRNSLDKVPVFVIVLGSSLMTAGIGIAAIGLILAITGGQLAQVAIMFMLTVTLAGMVMVMFAGLRYYALRFQVMWLEWLVRRLEGD